MTDADFTPDESSLLFPAADAEQEAPWARAAKKDPVTSRSRRPLGDLPDWDPLPPGEVVVRRHRRD